MRLLILLFIFGTIVEARADELSADQIITKAIEYWRDSTSVIEASMLVHRPDWQRSMSMVASTKGRKKSLVRFTAPAKDAGSASLTVDEEMWSYSPKINRVIKIPSSMRSQSWMGSDFSYRDLSRSDDIIEYYDHKLVGEKVVDGVKAYLIEAIPKKNAPVVWGKEEVLVREDYIIVEHKFFDQEGKLVKKLTASEVKMLGGKLFATTIRMENLENNDEWTQIIHNQASFGNDLPDAVFTLSNLRNPRN